MGIFFQTRKSRRSGQDRRMSFFVLCPETRFCLGPFQNGLEPLGPEPVESPSAVSLSAVSSRPNCSEPNGLQVERLEAEGQLANVIISSVYLNHFETATSVHLLGHKKKDILLSSSPLSAAEEINRLFFIMT